MEPLEATPMPTHAALIGITAANSWPTGTDESPIRVAYIATNSTQRISFVSLQTAAKPGNVLRIASRPSFFQDMPYGVVIEIHLAKDLVAGEAVYVTLAQCGASIYFPPQPIDDAK
jgi:hypothetical protein